MVPKLHKLLEITETDLPNFFLLSPMQGKSVAYPEKLELETTDPNLLLQWARITSFEQEYNFYHEKLLAEGDSDELTMEMFHAEMEPLLPLVEELRKELEEHKETLKTDNPFSEHFKRVQEERYGIYTQTQEVDPSQL